MAAIISQSINARRNGMKKKKKNSGMTASENHAST